MGKIGKKTRNLYNYALISLMTGFSFIYMYIDGKISEAFLIITIPAVIAGIYFLSEAYHRTKKEL